MKRLWISVLGVILMLGMIGVPGANATSTDGTTANTENTQSTLTVVFGAPPVFDPALTPQPAATPNTQASSSVAEQPKVVVEEPTQTQTTTIATPEPSTLFLLGLGVFGLLGLARWKKK